MNRMEFTPAPLPGIWIIRSHKFADDRGYFQESFNRKKWEEAGLPSEFVQDNQSCSKKGVIRGLHFQRHPMGQGKLVRVLNGRALDVMVDIRAESTTFGRHFSLELTPENNTMLWIPEGFAHGFEALEDDTIFLYKVTNYYDPGMEAGIRYDDPELNIKWQASEPIVSSKDKLLPTLKEWNASRKSFE
jgi:dTDP-4-dehydrorhamnose 3,5-epimerase